MSICGSVQHTKTITFRIEDNMRRENPEVVVRLTLAESSIDLPVKQISNYTYEFSVKAHSIGIGLMEVYFDKQKISQSPVRVEMMERQCEDDFPGEGKASDQNGNCVCREGTITFRGRCTESYVLAIPLSVVALLLVAMVCSCYIGYRNRKNDEMWIIGIDELEFDDPVEVIGQGSFGVVCLSHYRGTKVALKRALKRQSGSKRGSRRGGSRSGSGGGSKGGSRGGSKQIISRQTSNDTDIQISSSSDSERDPELGSCAKDGAISSSEEAMQGSTGGTSNSKSSGSDGASNSKSSGSTGVPSLGFIQSDFGHAKKWTWMLPWKKQRKSQSHFKEAILGGNSSFDFGQKSWHSVLCPWFNDQAKLEREFIQEMRVLSRLRHPCITTVLGAVISRKHDPMLVSKFPIAHAS